MDITRVGVVGTGALGRHHTRLYGECDGAEVVGRMVYDLNREGLKHMPLRAADWAM